MQRRRAIQARAEKKNKWREERSERHAAELVASLARRATRQREREIRSHVGMDTNTLEMEILEYEHAQTWNAMDPGMPCHTGILVAPVRAKVDAGGASGPPAEASSAALLPSIMPPRSVWRQTAS